jgi:hypothetical protein
MQKCIAAIAVFVFFCLFVPPVFAQQQPNSQPATQTASQNSASFSFLKFGLFMGRSGTAVGPNGYLEFNPVRWAGICAVVAQSSAAANADGGRAHDWDFSSGLCATGHLPPLKGLLISPFAQLEYENNHERIAIPIAPDVAPNLYFTDGDNHMRRQWILGAMFDRAIMKNGPHWALRIGRDYGKGPAAQNAEGLYCVSGLLFPLDHPVRLAKSFKLW